jgi:hypothetical protein
MAGVPVTSTLKSSAGYTGAIALDYLKFGETAVQVTVTSTGGGLTYNIEFSADTVADSSLMTWFSSLGAGLSTNALVTTAVPFKATRVNLTAGTSNTAISATVVQSQL